MNWSISSAAAAARTNTSGGPSRLVPVAASGLPSSRPLSQLTMGFEEIEEWKRNKTKQTGLVASRDKTPKPTIFDLKIGTPIYKSSAWNISYAPDEVGTQFINTSGLQRQINGPSPVNDDVLGLQVLRILRPEANEIMDNEKAMSLKKPKETVKFVIVNTKLILKARLSESPDFRNLADPDNEMGVDHKAFYQRQVPLFLGGGPFC